MSKKVTAAFADRVLTGIIILFTVLLPVWDNPAPVLLALWALVLPFGSYAKITAIGRWPMLLLVSFLVFFFLHLLGLAFTDDYQLALRELLLKLPLLVIPALVFFSRRLIHKNLNLILWSYLVVATAGALFCISTGLANYMDYPSSSKHRWELLFYDDISLFMHPSYLTMHYILATAVALYFAGMKKHPFKHAKAAYYSAVIILSIFVFMLSSKASLIAVFLLLLFFTVRYCQKLHSRKLRLILLMSLLVLGSLLFVFNTRFIWLYQSLSEVDMTSTELAPGREYNHVPARLLSWRAALEILQDNWLTGTGTGDSREELQVIYHTYGMDKMIAGNYNTHSQFLESAVTLGILGLVLLLLLFFFAFRTAMHPFAPLLFTVIITVFVNFLFESMLYRQAGVLFFSYFFSLFAVAKNEKAK